MPDNIPRTGLLIENHCFCHGNVRACPACAGARPICGSRIRQYYRRGIVLDIELRYRLDLVRSGLVSRRGSAGIFRVVLGTNNGEHRYAPPAVPIPGRRRHAQLTAIATITATTRHRCTHRGYRYAGETRRNEGGTSTGKRRRSRRRGRARGEPAAAPPRGGGGGRREREETSKEDEAHGERDGEMTRTEIAKEWPDRDLVLHIGLFAG